MENIIKNNAKFVDHLTWSFPSIGGEKKNDVAGEKQEDEISELRATIARLQTELDGFKSEHRKKMSVVHHVIDDLKKTVKFVDDETCFIIKDIVAKCTKKIIQNEIAMDSNVIREIMSDAQELLSDTVGKIRIHLSEADAKLFMEEKWDASIVIVTDRNLQSGDIYIKSESTDINGMLDSRINLLLGIDNG